MYTMVQATHMLRCSLACDFAVLARHFALRQHVLASERLALTIVQSCNKKRARRK